MWAIRCYIALILCITVPLATAASFPRTMTDSITTTTGGPISDGFNTGTLGGIWTFNNPVGDGSYTMPGTQLRLAVPAFSDHVVNDATGNKAVFVTQPIANGDFTMTVKFDTIPSLQYTWEGIIVQQDATNYLVFHYGSDSVSVYVSADKVIAGTSTGLLSTVRSVAGATSLWLRVQRVGNVWTETWSTDGITYSTEGSFTQALTVATAGVYAGNLGNGGAINAPAWAVLVDSVTGSGTANPLEAVTTGRGKARSASDSAAVSEALGPRRYSAFRNNADLFYSWPGMTALLWSQMSAAAWAQVSAANGSQISESMGPLGRGKARFPADTGLVSEALARHAADARAITDSSVSTVSLARQEAILRAQSDGTLSTAFTAKKSLLRAEADGTLAETVSRGTLATSRALADGTLSELIARKLAGNRSLADVSVSETPARAVGWTRGTSDVSFGGEVASRTNAASRSFSDGTLSEVFTRRLNGIRTASDGTLSESNSSNQGLLRSAADGSLSGESSSRAAMAATRAASDGTLAEALGRKTGASRQIADFSFSESAARSPIAMARSFTAGTLAENISRANTFTRTFADAAPVSEAPGRLMALFRTESAAGVTSTSMSSVFAAGSHNAFSGAMSNTALFSEAISPQLSAFRGTADTAAIAAIAVRSFGNTRAAADTGFVSAAESRLLSGYRAAADTGFIGEISGSPAAKSRGIVDSFPFATVVGRVTGATRSAANTGLATEAILNVASLNRGISGVAFVSAVPSKAFTGGRAAADSSLVSSAAARVYGSQRTVANTSLTAETPGSRLGANRSAADFGFVVEHEANAFAGLRTLADTGLAAVAQPSRLLASNRGTADSLPIAAVFNNPAGLFLRAAGDVGFISESPAELRAFHRASFSAAVTTPFVNRSLGQVRFLSDSNVIATNIQYNRQLLRLLRGPTITERSIAVYAQWPILPQNSFAIQFRSTGFAVPDRPTGFIVIYRPTEFIKTR